MQQSESTDFSAVPAALLDVDLDNALRQHDEDPTAEHMSRVARAWNAVPQALLFAPRVTFKVRDANRALAALVDMFGVESVLRLLDTGAVDFLQWTQDFMTLEKAAPPPEGYMPFLWMHWGTPWTNDVDVVADRGLKKLRGVSESHIEQLREAAARRTAVVADSTINIAYRTVLDAIEQGALVDVGVVPNETMNSLPNETRSLVLSHMQNIAVASVLVDRELDLNESPDTWTSLLKLTKEVTSGSEVLHCSEVVLRTEQIPSIADLLRDRVLDGDAVLKLRESAAAREFRDWLWSQPDPANANNVVSAYRSEVARFARRELSESKWFGRIRTVAVGVAGFFGGNVTEATIGLPPGVLSVAANISAGIAVTALDQTIDKIRARSPRRLTSLLREMSIAQQSY